MQFVKSYWISLASGLVAVVALVIGVIGMTSDSVIKEMETRKRPVDEIQGLMSNAQNEKTIDVQKRLGKQFNEKYGQLMDEAMKINGRQPLMEGVFPKPTQTENPFTFKRTYSQKIDQLLSDLDAGGLPNDQELTDEAEMVSEEQRKKKEQEGDTSDAAAAPTARPSAPPSRPPMAPPGGGGRMAPPGGGGRSMPPGGGRGMPPGGGRGMPPQSTGNYNVAQPVVVTAASVTPEVQQRAAVKKATKIRIYATRTDLNVSPITETPDSPTPRDMWFAQLGLWLQEDLVAAIKALNDEAAKQLSDKDANVTRLPVKRILSVSLDGYYTPAGLVTSSLTGTNMGADAGPSFTGRKTTPEEQFDVIRFKLKVVVERRSLMKLVDAVTRANFYQLIGAEYETAPLEDATNGYYYGEAPIIVATLDFEGYLARKVFKPMIPPDVLKDLGLEQAAAATPEGQGQ